MAQKTIVAECMGGLALLGINIKSVIQCMQHYKQEPIGYFNVICFNWVRELNPISTNLLIQYRDGCRHRLTLWQTNHDTTAVMSLYITVPFSWIYMNQEQIIYVSETTLFTYMNERERSLGDINV